MPKSPEQIYQPTKGDVEKAEEAMTEEQEGKSEKREKELNETNKQRTIFEAKLLEKGGYYEGDVAVASEHFIRSLKEERDQDLKKREKVDKIDNLENKIISRRSELEKEYSQPEKIKEREKIVEGFKYYPINGKEDYKGNNFYFLRLSDGIYFLRPISNDRFQRMIDKKIDLKERHKNFIENNESNNLLYSFFGSYGEIRDCLSFGLVNEGVLDSLKEIIKDDNSDEIKIGIPCEGGTAGGCAGCFSHDEDIKKIIENSNRKMIFTYSSDESLIDEFKGIFSEATGKIIESKYYNNSLVEYTAEYKKLIPLLIKRSQLLGK